MKKVLFASLAVLAVMFTSCTTMNYEYQELGISIYYAEGMGTIANNLAEIQADGFCAVPRVMEMFYDRYLPDVFVRNSLQIAQHIEEFADWINNRPKESLTHRVSVSS